MKKCLSCSSSRIASISAKCSDCFSMRYQLEDYNGYVPDNIGIGGGDYVEFNYCLECGVIQGSQFPTAEPDLEDY